MKTILIGVFLFASISNCFSASNLTCYQCKKNTDEECGPQDLKPCASTYDRCAIHYTKNDRDGFSIKRECGLAPCGFDDEMATKGLGMNCDRSKKEYTCTYCCTKNGCNQNDASTKVISTVLILTAIILVSFLNVARDFIPPYVMGENTYSKK